MGLNIYDNGPAFMRDLATKHMNDFNNELILRDAVRMQQDLEKMILMQGTDLPKKDYMDHMVCGLKTKSDGTIGTDDDYEQIGTENIDDGAVTVYKNKAFNRIEKWFTSNMGKHYIRINSEKYIRVRKTDDGDWKLAPKEQFIKNSDGEWEKKEFE